MKMKFSQDIDYWNHKVKAFLHDPPDKAIQIPGHEMRANLLLDALGIQSSLDPAEYKQADIIASGMDRAVLPGFSRDPQKNGAIDFCEHSAITHPSGNDAPLCITLPVSDRKTLVDQISSEMQGLLKNDVGEFTDGKGLSEKPLYKGDEQAFASARFNYLFFLLKQRLAAKNIGGLGGLWHRLPADTRIPDHSIWQHNGLVSALASCFRLSEQNQASLMVFALTPVQDFVGRARKLRDYWSGSILLSWLAFEGIKAVIYELGADHIIYPSLHGQPLIDGLLREWQMDDLLQTRSSTSGVASFPNKFVCLVPRGKEAEFAALIEDAIQKKWLELGRNTVAMVKKTFDDRDTSIEKQFDFIEKQFQHQLGSYWEYHWAASPLVRKQDWNKVEELLNRESIDALFRFVKDSDALLAGQNIRSGSGEGQLYSVTHRLAQTMLTAGKSFRQNRRPEEEGVKCDMFGEFEIIHFPFKADDDQNPKPSEDLFWQKLKQHWKPESDFGKSERLCAIGLVKRLAYRVCRKMDNHPLRDLFAYAEVFPSTTEIALHDWWGQACNRAKEDQEFAADLAEFDKSGSIRSDRALQQLAQWFHELNESEQTGRQGREIIEIDAEQRAAARRIFKKHKVGDIHKYYAVLMMDGDRMGSLVNGETLGATWGNVIHPHLVRNMQGGFEKNYQQFWWKNFAEIRQISPAVHAAISESLGDFSLFSVPEVIKRKNDRLIYAGGDDVCAIMPVSTVLDTAREIACAYGQGFVFRDENGEVHFLTDTWTPMPGKLAVYLGRGEKITISAGIMIAHHKKPLSKVIDRTHQLLDMAKQEGGRNSFALELDKRSGGGRVFMARWNDMGSEKKKTILEHFNETAAALQTSEQNAMSTSLAYRLAMFENGLLPIIDKPELLRRFIVKQLERSSPERQLPKEERMEKLKQTAVHVAELLAHQNSGQNRLRAESLVIANFIGHCRGEREAAQ